MSLNMLNPSLISCLGVSEIVLARRVSEGHVHVNSAKSPPSLPKAKGLGKDHSEILTAMKTNRNTFAFLSGGYTTDV